MLYSCTHNGNSRRQRVNSELSLTVTCLPISDRIELNWYKAVIVNCYVWFTMYTVIMVYTGGYALCSENTTYIFSISPRLMCWFTQRLHWFCPRNGRFRQCKNKKAQLSLTKPRDAKACQNLLQFDVLTTLSLTILACCCVRNLRNPAKFTENSNLWSSRSFKVIDLVSIESPCTTSY